MAKINWKAETRRIASLIPADYNPRELSETQEKQLRESLDRFSLADPIIINADNKVIGGHQRLKVLLAQGIEIVDVRVPDRQLNEHEERELNLRLNKNTGDWDFSKLASFDEDMLKNVGFSGPELDQIFKADPSQDEDDVPEERETVSIQRGDMFRLGDHVLMCGDSISQADVAKLMAGQTADMIHTDPPYNIDYGSTENPRHKIREIKNDNMSTEQWEIFCKALYANFKEFNRGDIYMWGASGPNGMRMRLWIVELGANWSATIIWRKDRLILSPSKYQRQYEPCFYGWFGKSSYQGDRTQTEVWDIERPTNSSLHPTMKPVALCEKAIENSSPRGGVVLDFFGGSGSTLIACEKLSRKCRMIEIDPVYCQRIIDRWEKFSGKKAEKIEWAEHGHQTANSQA